MGLTSARKQEKLNYFYSVNNNAYENIMMQHYGEFKRNNLIKKMSIKRHEKVLDAATGTGLNIKHILKDAKIFAIDINKDMISQIYNNSKNKTPAPTIGDIRKLPFKDNTFNHTIITYGLSGSFNTNLVLEEIIRVTKPNGKIGILDFTHAGSNPEYGFGGIHLKKEIYKIRGKTTTIYKKNTFFIPRSGLEQAAYILKVKK